MRLQEGIGLNPIAGLYQNIPKKRPSAETVDWLGKTCTERKHDPGFGTSILGLMDSR
jgi:hypothetical protein